MMTRIRRQTLHAPHPASLALVLCTGCMSGDMHRAALAASLVDALADAQSYWADAAGPAQSLYVPFEGADGNVSGTMMGTIGEVAPWDDDCTCGGCESLAWTYEIVGIADIHGVPWWFEDTFVGQGRDHPMPNVDYDASALYDGRMEVREARTHAGCFFKLVDWAGDIDFGDGALPVHVVLAYDVSEYRWWADVDGRPFTWFEEQAS